MPAFIAENPGIASGLFQSDQFNRRAALSDAYNQMMNERFRQQAAATQRGQFQQDLAARLQMSRDAQERMALARAMQLQNQEHNLVLREAALRNQTGRFDTTEADKKHTTRYNAALFEAQNGTYDSKNYPDLPDEERGLFERMQSAFQKPVETQYKTAGDLATQGNQFNRLQKDVADLSTAPKTDVSPWWVPWPFRSHEAGTIQPSDHALAIRAQLAQAMPGALQQGIASGALTRQPITGGYVNVTPVPANIRYVPPLQPATATPPAKWLRQPTPKDLDTLRANPDRAAQFDQIYGQGTANEFLSQI